MVRKYLWLLLLSLCASLHAASWEIGRQSGTWYYYRHTLIENTVELAKKREEPLSGTEIAARAALICDEWHKYRHTLYRDIPNPAIAIALVFSESDFQEEVSVGYSGPCYGMFQLNICSVEESRKIFRLHNTSSMETIRHDNRLNVFFGLCELDMDFRLQHGNVLRTILAYKCGNARTNWLLHNHHVTEHYKGLVKKVHKFYDVLKVKPWKVKTTLGCLFPFIGWLTSVGFDV